MKKRRSQFSCAHLRLSYSLSLSLSHAVLETPLSLTSGDMPVKIMFVCHANNTFDVERRRLLMLKIHIERGEPSFYRLKTKPWVRHDNAFSSLRSETLSSLGFLNLFSFCRAQEHQPRREGVALQRNERQKMGKRMEFSPTHAVSAEIFSGINACVQFAGEFLSLLTQNKATKGMRRASPSPHAARMINNINPSMLKLQQILIL
jgi:hypothetical protein